MYDILFVELNLGYECILPLAEKFKIPVIGTLSHRQWVYTSDVFGDLQPLANPYLSLPLPKKMGFFQRLQNVFANLCTRFMIKYFWESRLADFYAEYFPDFNLQSNRDISVVFSSDYASVFSTELTPKVVGIAGIHLTPVKPLPQVSELDSWSSYIFDMCC